MKKFVAADCIDYWENDSEFLHVNPNIIVDVKLLPTIGEGIFINEYPWTVTTTVVSFSGLEPVDYSFKTKEKAKAFITNLGSIG